MSPLVRNTGGTFGCRSPASNPAHSVTVDGVGGDATLNGTNVHFYQEVSVVTGNNSAEFPRPAQISMVSRSGTNQFHGVFQSWNQDSALAARDFFAPTKPESETHNMVADVSGPLLKNRTFGLFVWEGQRIPASTFYLRDVPTNAMRTGDFSQLLNAASPVQLRDPLTGRRLQATSFLGSIQSRGSPGHGPIPSRAQSRGADGVESQLRIRVPLSHRPVSPGQLHGRVDHKISNNNTISDGSNWRGRSTSSTAATRTCSGRACGAPTT